MSTETTPVFVVERYTSERELVRLLPKLLIEPAGGVRHLMSVYLPGEETVFSVYEGCSVLDVIVANGGAGLPFERVIRAIVLTPMSRWPAGEEPCKDTDADANQLTIARPTHRGAERP